MDIHSVIPAGMASDISGDIRIITATAIPPDTDMDIPMDIMGAVMAMGMDMDLDTMEDPTDIMGTVMAMDMVLDTLMDIMGAVMAMDIKARA